MFDARICSMIIPCNFKWLCNWIVSSNNRLNPLHKVAPALSTLHPVLLYLSFCSGREGRGLRAHMFRHLCCVSAEETSPLACLPQGLHCPASASPGEADKPAGPTSRPITLSVQREYRPWKVIEIAASILNL